MKAHNCNCNYKKIQLTTRFNSSILIYPLYHRTKENKQNKQLMIEYIQKSSSESSFSLNVVPFEDEALSISSIQLQSTAQTFYIEGEISLSNEFQYFYVLCCSKCKHLVRMKRKKIIQCINCKLYKMLIPRCEFEVEITDASGTMTAIISDKLAERILSMTADQIYETTIVKKQLIHIEDVREELSQKWFKVHLQKSLLWTPNKTPSSLIILSLHEKETIFDLPPVSTPTNVAARGKKKLQSLAAVEEYDASPAEEISSSKSLKYRINANITTLNVRKIQSPLHPSYFMPFFFGYYYSKITHSKFLAYSSYESEARLAQAVDSINVYKCFWMCSTNCNSNQCFWILCKYKCKYK